MFVVKTYDQTELADLFGPHHHEYQEPNLFDHVWQVRPRMIVHIAGLDDGIAPVSTVARYSRVRAKARSRVLRSVADASQAANTLKIPFVLVNYGGGDIPATESGLMSLACEDVAVAKKQLIVRVNGLFGPEAYNKVWRMVTSDTPTCDDILKVNPLSTKSLAGFVKIYRPETRRIIRLGDYPAATWYEIFAQLHPNVKPWADKNALRHKEYNWEWEYPAGLPTCYTPPFHALQELHRWLREQGHEVLPLPEPD